MQMIPPALAADAGISPGIATGTGAAPGAALTVLCIENDPSSLALIERAVRSRAPVELLVATDGVLGTELARQHRPDLVVTDLDAAGIGGEEVLARLQADPRTRSVPVIVSGHASSGVSGRLIGRGAQCYLPKPIDVTELVRAIEHGVDIPNAA
jgi:CheY-like chemotaxis protein